MDVPPLKSYESPGTCNIPFMNINNNSFRSISAESGSLISTSKFNKSPL